MLLDFDDILGTTRSTELSIVQVVDFPFCAKSGVSFFSIPYENLWFKHSLRSNTIAGVSSTNCTVAKRSRSWTKTCAYSLFAYWAHFSLLSVVRWNSRVHSKRARFCVSGLHKRINTLLMFGFKLAYFLAKFHAALLTQSSCSEVSSGGCSSKLSAQGFHWWGSPFVDTSSRLPFSFRNSVFYQVHYENFRCVPPKPSFPIPQLSEEENSLAPSLEKHYLGPPEEQLILEYLLLDLALRLLSPSACRHRLH